MHLFRVGLSLVLILTVAAACEPDTIADVETPLPMEATDASAKKGDKPDKGKKPSAEEPEPAPAS